MTIRTTLLCFALASSTAYAQDADPRPAARAVGIGVGWSFPQSILEPNTVSARFRFGRLALEPSVRLGGDSGVTYSQTTTTVGMNPPNEVEDSDRSGGFELSAGAGLRYAVASKGPVDLLALGGVSLGYTNRVTNQNVLTPGTLDRQSTGIFSTTLSWGLGLEWFLGWGLALSADIQNPLLSYSRTHVHTERETASGVTTLGDSITGTFTGALTFRPTVRVMLHLYF